MNVYKDKKKFSKLSSGLCVGDWISNDVQTEVAILQAFRLHKNITTVE